MITVLTAQQQIQSARAEYDATDLALIAAAADAVAKLRDGSRLIGLKPETRLQVLLELRSAARDITTD